MSNILYNFFRNVDSLGPLPYLDPVNLYVNPDYTNTPTSGALAALLQKSSNLSPNNANDSPGTFKYNKSCDDISNVLLNSAAQVSDDKYQITNSTFPSSFWNLPFSSNNESLVSIIWAMGPQVSPIFGGTPTNILNLAQLSLAINNSPQYSPTTSQVWFPIVGSNSKGFTYIYSEGYRGRQINESWWSTPGDEFRLKYDTNGTYAPPSNDTLHVRMVEVLDITFNRTTFTKGIDLISSFLTLAYFRSCACLLYLLVFRWARCQMYCEFKKRFGKGNRNL